MTEDKNQYRPLFLEELFVVHLYGTDEEMKRFYALMENRDNFENVVAMAALIEDIKRKNLTNLNWFCCSKCQNYKICRINWYRGEKNIERNCCTYCQYYDKCYDSFKGDPEAPALSVAEGKSSPQKESPVDPTPEN